MSNPHVFMIALLKLQELTMSVCRRATLSLMVARASTFPIQNNRPRDRNMHHLSQPCFCVQVAVLGSNVINEPLLSTVRTDNKRSAAVSLHDVVDLSSPYHVYCRRVVVVRNYSLHIRDFVQVPAGMARHSCRSSGRLRTDNQARDTNVLNIWCSRKS